MIKIFCSMMLWKTAQRTIRLSDEKMTCILLIHQDPSNLKFIYSEKATKFCKFSTVNLSYVVPVKSTVVISQNFVAFSEYMNFRSKSEPSAKSSPNRPNSNCVEPSSIIPYLQQTWPSMSDCLVTILFWYRIWIKMKNPTFINPNYIQIFFKSCST